MRHSGPPVLTIALGAGGFERVAALLGSFGEINNFSRLRDWRALGSSGGNIIFSESWGWPALGSFGGNTTFFGGGIRIGRGRDEGAGPVGGAWFDGGGSGSHRDSILADGGWWIGVWQGFCAWVRWPEVVCFLWVRRSWNFISGGCDRTYEAAAEDGSGDCDAFVRRRRHGGCAGRIP